MDTLWLVLIWKYYYNIIY